MLQGRSSTGPNRHPRRAYALTLQNGITTQPYQQTHNVAMASAIAQYIVAMGTDGRIASCGAPSDVIAQDAQLAAKVEHEQAAIATDEAADAATDSEITPTKVVDAPQGGKLTLAEEIQEGHVSWQACEFY